VGELKENLNLSGITLGTMRFVDKGLSVNQIQNIIEKSFEVGIDVHHSSFEYNSYELYKTALAKTAVKSKIKHIVKLSSPHFDEKEFSSKKLVDLIDRELISLKVDCIDVLQWLVRSTPINDHDRIKILIQQKDLINSSFAQLKKEGKIKSVFSFPYSIPFAQEVIDIDEVDGVISYLNKNETEYQYLANKHPFIAIRPFNAGHLVTTENYEMDIQNCLTFVRNHTNVITQIVSINSLNHLKTISRSLT
jgi:aryl-alcohol dehydrogenase-like predicted oxidoreductase